MIDFGDAYFGHPIFDMWYWGVEDKNHLLAGYTVNTPVNSDFMVIFRAVNAIDEMIDEVSAKSGERKSENGWE